MKQLFDPEGMVMQTLTVISDMLLLNLCFVICAIPVVTIGAANAALYGVLLRQEEIHTPVRSFFARFRQNFRQATAAWLIVLAIGAFLLMDMQLLRLLDTAYPLVEIVLKIGAFLLVAVNCYTFALLSLYRGSVVETLKNALILSVAALPRSVLVVLLAVLPVVVLILDISLFIRFIFPWLIFGIAVTAKLSALLMKPAFIRFLNSDA